MEPLVRPRDDFEVRSVRVIVRVLPSTCGVIDVYAKQHGWTRSDAMRYLLGKGMEAEGI